ncbi:hypothetical protein GO013_07285 [Pseudodesulfovibrio sp. JC047]|uniref:hypothetical protein n=1 Tax=Pseudodesulfovibrio sp. JC047 TaxID=2683199 RepID=UPI0013D2C703|nr:hypothetical protein [Pseudodesulfovibrio sp. JC047]NDV19221.1 hypothetical protein [Pseudodesulfovibrio sp. JC047]
MNAAELTNEFKSMKAEFTADINKLFKAMDAVERRLVLLESRPGPSEECVVHGSDDAVLSVLIEHFGAKEKEGVSVPVLEKLRGLRGDEQTEDAESAIDEAARDGGKEGLTHAL